MANRYEVLWFMSESGESYTVNTTFDGQIIIESDTLGDPAIVIKRDDAVALLAFLNDQLKEEDDHGEAD